MSTAECNKNNILKYTEQDVHFANFSKPTTHVLRLKGEKNVYVTSPRSAANSPKR